MQDARHAGPDAVVAHVRDDAEAPRVPKDANVEESSSALSPRMIKADHRLAMGFRRRGHAELDLVITRDDEVPCVVNGNGAGRHKARARQESFTLEPAVAMSAMMKWSPRIRCVRRTNANDSGSLQQAFCCNIESLRSLSTWPLRGPS